MTPKQFQFRGTAGGFFVASVITTLAAYIPIFGLPISMNYFINWIAENSLINGKEIKYTAEYGETLKFLIVGVLLIIVTFGIYAFWFGPKTYRFVADHLSFIDAMATPFTPATGMPISPISPAPPSAMPPQSTQPPIVSA
jgi:uncharacterized membrane protein YjgN (DUF898 family)